MASLPHSVSYVYKGLAELYIDSTQRTRTFRMGQRLWASWPELFGRKIRGHLN